MRKKAVLKRRDIPPAVPEFRDFLAANQLFLVEGGRECSFSFAVEAHINALNGPQFGNDCHSSSTRVRRNVILLQLNKYDISFVRTENNYCIQEAVHRF